MSNSYHGLKDVRHDGYIRFIAYLQIIGIIIVVAGHSMHEVPDYGSTVTYRLIDSFQMPLFMFVSGFLLLYSTHIRPNAKRPKIRAFTRSKAQRLLIPYIFLTVATFMPRSILSGIADDEISFTWRAFLLSMTYMDHLVIPYLWFLQVCFVLLVVCYGLILMGEKAGLNDSVIYSGLVLLFAALYFFVPVRTSFFSLSEVPKFGIYFALGIIFCRYFRYIDRYVPYSSWWFAPAMCAGWITSFLLFEGGAEMLLCALFAIMMCTSVCIIMERRNIRLLDHLLGATYMIYLLSWYFNVATQQILAHFTDFPWYVYSFLSLFTSIYIPLLIFRAMQSYSCSKGVRTVAWLLGHKTKRIQPNPRPSTAFTT